MAKKPTYQNIDMERTGRKMKYMLEAAGFTPKMIQDYLHLSCVQPIYRWYKGKILPSVDHLLMLSELLHVHMEELIVKKNTALLTFDLERINTKATEKRYMAYYKKIQQSAA